MASLRRATLRDLESGVGLSGVGLSGVGLSGFGQAGLYVLPCATATEDFELTSD